MGILTGIIIGFLCIQLAVALVNYYDSRQSTSAADPGIGQLSILIPARNEEHTLPLLLDDLLHLPEQPLEIIICDDHSEDNTYTLVSHLATLHPHLHIFRGNPLPSGWLGKNFACHQLAQQASGDYLLFLDADVRVRYEGIRTALAQARKLQTALLSVFPRQIMLTSGEKATVPLMTYILLTLLPLPLVWKVGSQPALAAANGQFMLFRTAAYRRVEPHSIVRREAVEDVATSRLFKRRGYRVACLTGIPGICCRMYTSRREAINGFSRNIAGFFGGSLLLAALFWALTGWGWIVIMFAFSWPGLLVYLGIRAVVRFLVARACCQSAGTNILYSPLQQGNMGCILFHAWLCRKKGRQEWKGRNISLSACLIFLLSL